MEIFGTNTTVTLDEVRKRFEGVVDERQYCQAYLDKSGKDFTCAEAISEYRQIVDIYIPNDIEALLRIVLYGEQEHVDRLGLLTDL